VGLGKYVFSQTCFLASVVDPQNAIVEVTGKIRYQNQTFFGSCFIVNTLLKLACSMPALDIITILKF